MRIGLYGVMNLNNNFAGVWGISNIRLPFIIEGLKRGHKFTYFGHYAGRQYHNPFLDLLKIKKQVTSVASRVQRSSRVVSLKNVDALLIEARPSFNPEEFAVQEKLIRRALKLEKKVLVWDMDLWAQDLPEELREQVVLLRPYCTKNELFDEQYEFHYYTFPYYHKFSREKMLDFVYIGNQYQRAASFNRFFGQLTEREYPPTTLVAGNWLKESKRDESLKHEGVMFAREVEHWAAVPLLARARATIQIVRDDYKRVGLMSDRIFEASIAGTLCFADKGIHGIRCFVPQQLLATSGSQVYNKFSSFSPRDFKELLAEQKVLLSSQTVHERFDEFERIVKGEQE